ncbi:MAG: hypothetical protein QW343_01110 [Candidatus Norongarragalinales archaeon]
MTKTKSSWIRGKGYDKRVIAFLYKTQLLFQEVRIRGGERVPPHFHARADEHFLVFEAKPKLRFLIGRKWISPTKGDYFAVKAKTRHAVDASRVKTKTAARFLVAKTNYSGDDSAWDAKLVKAQTKQEFVKT